VLSRGYAQAKDRTFVWKYTHFPQVRGMEFEFS